MYLENLLIIANKLDNNKLYHFANDLDIIINSLSNNEIAHKNWNNIVIANKDKLNEVYAKTLLDSSLKLAYLSNEINNKEIKDDLIKSSKELFNLAKEAGIDDALKDLGTGLWNYVSSPFQGMGNYGRYVRTQNKVKEIVKNSRDMMTKINSLKDENQKENSRNQTIKYLQDEKDSFESIASDSVIKNDKYSNNLANNIINILDTCINLLESHETVAVLGNLNRSLLSVIAGRQPNAIQVNEPQTPQSSKSSEDYHKRPSKSRESYYVQDYNAGNFVRSNPTKWKDIFEYLEIPEDMNKWKKWSNGGMRFYIPSEKIKDFINSYPNGQAYFKELFHTEVEGNEDGLGDSGESGGKSDLYEKGRQQIYNSRIV